jgi:hypothetical protein
MMDKTHILFLSVLLFFVLLVFYMFGEGSVEGFGETVDIPITGLPIGSFKVIKKNANGTNMLDSNGAIQYGMITVPPGYYASSKKDENGNEMVIIAGSPDKDYELKKVPYGYMASPDKFSINPSTKASQYATYENALTTTSDAGATSERNYNPIDASFASAYHDTPGNENLGKYYFYDKDGNLTMSDVSGTNVAPVIYYIPGSYKYGASNYVPNYEDSVYMSRTTRQSTVTPVLNTSSILGGFCAQNKGSASKLEESCNALDVTACASTSCCVLLGGQKCVAGNDRGPTNPANYSDFRVVNKDVYYYQGKCYGNCV